jgi:demethylmenaquinone methyltransferase/2-methoxy-6-polyprenyl-1,4-benzoquinol methylase
VSLRDTISTPAGKAPFVRRLFSTIADRYDLITVLLSYGQDRRWKRRLIDLAGALEGRIVLDLACGTGDIACLAAGRGATVIGLDVTPRMIDLARAKAARRFAIGGASQLLKNGSARPELVEGRTKTAAFLRVRGSTGSPRTGFQHPAKAPPPQVLVRAPSFVVADMMALPFPDQTVDVVTTGYGLRNVPVLGDAIAEIRRVLRPGGMLVSLDFNRPLSPPLRFAYHTYLTVVGSALGLALHGNPDTYRYIPESIRRYPDADQVAFLLRSAGFESARWERVLGGLMAIHVAQ